MRSMMRGNRSPAFSSKSASRSPISAATRTLRRSDIRWSPQAQAALDRAQLDLSYTVVSAPTDGVVAKVEQLQVGRLHRGVHAGVCAGIHSRCLDRGQLQGSSACTHARRARRATVKLDRYPGRNILRRR